jgi:nitrogen fixation protein NifX
MTASVRKLKLLDGGLSVSSTERQRREVMKVAFCTQDLARVDAHFGWAKNIVIYEVGTSGFRMLEAVQFGGSMFEDGNEDKLIPKLKAIEDCAILYVSAIGASAAARIVAKKIHPIKVDNPEPITDLLNRLIGALNATPPPWLRKALLRGQNDVERNFEDEE